MNKIFTFTFLGALGLALVAQAAPRSEADALRLAKSFYASQQPLRSASEASFQLVYTGESGSLRSTSSDPYYYIYNVGEGGGFVMISGDDRVDPVIGYSTSGGFDPANMPSNLKAWFAGYERQIDYARTRPEEVFSASGALRSTAGVEPLIKTTWDQGSPYNDLCPEDINGQRSLTGCVATATAQVMNYHQWPEDAATGTGSYTLELTKETGVVNLEGIIFDWTNMADTYDGNTTTAQDSAVALLMYAVGPAVKMVYSYNGSGAELYDVPNALVNNFGYDLNVSYVKWNNHTNEEWYTILRTELEANRPIVYAGGGSVDEGHAFICDGYDANNAYHFNWGWSGEYDGYYKLSVLNPEYEFEIQEFVMNQEAVIGIQKPTGESQEYGALYCIGIDPDGDDEDDEDDEADIAQGGDLSFDLSLIYEGPLPSSDVELSIELYQNGGSVKALFKKELDVVDDSLFVGTGIPVKIENLTLEEGSYEMKLFYRFVKEGPPHEMAYSSLAVWTDWGLYASKDSIQWINTVSKMSGTPISIEEQVDEDGDPVAWVISTTLQNEDTTRNIAPYIFLNIENFIYVEAGQVSLAAGEKASVQMLAPWQELDPGEYEVVLMYSDGNDGERIEGTESILHVNEDGTTAIEAVESQSLTVRQSGDRLLITSDDTLQAARLYDRSGRLVRTTKDTTVSVAGLSNGTYILQLETGKGTYVKKLSIH